VTTAKRPSDGDGMRIQSQFSEKRKIKFASRDVNEPNPLKRFANRDFRHTRF
jgi:hypothetical protein